MPVSTFQNHCLEDKWTFGDPFLESGVEAVLEGRFYQKRFIREMNGRRGQRHYDALQVCGVIVIQTNPTQLAPARVQTLDSKPETRNPKPETRNPKRAADGFSPHGNDLPLLRQRQVWSGGVFL